MKTYKPDEILDFFNAEVRRMYSAHSGSELKDKKDYDLTKLNRTCYHCYIETPCFSVILKSLSCFCNFIFLHRVVCIDEFRFENPNIIKTYGYTKIETPNKEIATYYDNGDMVKVESERIFLTIQGREIDN